MIYALLCIAAGFFALNMGGSNFGASFAAAHGGRVITARKAQLLFTVFVFLGAVTLGRPVAATLGGRIISPSLLKPDVVFAVIAAAALSIFIANTLHVPQSTSLVTVGALLGAGLRAGGINGGTFLYLAPFWIALPAIGYFVTFFLGKVVYPPRKSNFWIYEKLVNHTDRLEFFVIAASCYNAFSVGANNAANAAGPLAGANVIGVMPALAASSVLFGAGSFVFHHSLRTTGKKIVPLGLLTATIICLVTGTLMIAASLLGVPQSFVMIKVAAVMAIGGLKNGHRTTFANPATKKTYITWIVTPLIAVILSYVMTGVVYAVYR
ncbi:MAG: inorganic phosphate transporter [Candidatus Omnitrophota bacterium]